MTKVSIITVCFNGAQTIMQTIDSVLRQSYSNIEYLIIDGQSTDGTLDIIKEYEPLFEGRMRWVSEKDEGIYDAMNKGICMASGELIGVINSDDYYEEHAVETMVNAMTEEKYQILYGAVRSWKNGKEESVALLSHEFLRERMIGHPACFVTKSVYEDFGVYDTKYTSVADYDFMLRMYENKKVKFYPVNHVIANFRAGGMCSTDAAYLDLVKMQYDWKLISVYQYRKIMLISRLYHLFRRDQ